MQLCERHGTEIEEGHGCMECWRERKIQEANSRFGPSGWVRCRVCGMHTAKSELIVPQPSERWGRELASSEGKPICPICYVGGMVDGSIKVKTGEPYEIPAVVASFVPKESLAPMRASVEMRDSPPPSTATGTRSAQTSAPLSQSERSAKGRTVREEREPNEEQQTPTLSIGTGSIALVVVLMVLMSALGVVTGLLWQKQNAGVSSIEDLREDYNRLAAQLKQTTESQTSVDKKLARVEEQLLVLAELRKGLDAVVGELNSRAESVQRPTRP